MSPIHDAQLLVRHRETVLAAARSTGYDALLIERETTGGRNTRDGVGRIQVCVPGARAQFERSTGHRAITSWMPTVKMMSRLKSREAVDLVIMSDASLRELATQGVLDDEQRYPLVRSFIGVAVKAGSPRPDISSGDAVKRAVLASKSIVFSAGVPARASQPDAARAMIAYFTSSAFADVIRRHGLEPAAP